MGGERKITEIQIQLKVCGCFKCQFSSVNEDRICCLERRNDTF